MIGLIFIVNTLRSYLKVFLLKSVFTSWAYEFYLGVGLGTPSGTPTMLRLILLWGRSDGRYVHNLGLISTWRVKLTLQLNPPSCCSFE